MKTDYKNIIFLGDTHSITNTRDIIENKIPYNTLIIHCGDIGMGFSHLSWEEDIFSDISKKLNKINSKFIAIRGNHDDPKYFNDFHILNKKFSKNIYLAPDYTRFICNNISFLLVGGAISIDRIKRKMNVSWWINEEFFLNEYKIIKSDVLVTHSAPYYCTPIAISDIVKRWVSLENKITNGISNLSKILDKERKNIARLVKMTNPKIHVYGHFHFSNYEIIENRIHKLLGIDELWELPKDFKND